MADQLYIDAAGHLTDEHGVRLCPEAELRDAMNDGEFWAHVFGQDGPDQDYDPADDPNYPDPAELELNARLADPCPECGQVGACAYDAEGRPMIHVGEDSDA
jgi:hypothetical protein